MNTCDDSSVPGLVGVVDVGAHSVRLALSQVEVDGGVQTLEQLMQPVPLGADVFTSGAISAANVHLVGRILQDYRKVLDEYGVREVVAVATSAVREAENRDVFLHRVERMSGIRVQVLHGSEEVRLFYLGVLDRLRHVLDLRTVNAVVCTIGTGSSQISFLERGDLVSAETIRIGTLRLVEELDRPVSRMRLHEVIDPFVGAIFNGVARVLSNTRPDVLVALGAPVRALVRVGKVEPDHGVAVITRERFGELMRDIGQLPLAELVDAYGIAHFEAEGLEPCTNMLAHAFEITTADRLLVPMISTRDVLLAERLRCMRGDPDPFIGQILNAARSLGRKHNFDEAHAGIVASLAVQLFDQLKDEDLHQLDARDRLLLEVAAILHDIGFFVSSQQHHKHSYYLISNSQLPGVSPEEQQILALIARYHRRSAPQRNHLEFMMLDRDERIRVAKLAAVLRVADALDRRHQGRVRHIRVRVADGDLRMHTDCQGDLTLEQWGLTRKADLFNSVFGLNVCLSGES